MQAKRHAQVVTIAAALAGAGVLAGLIGLHADAVSEEIELLRIRLAGGIVILPASGARLGKAVDIDAGDIEVEDILRFIADSTGRPIIVDTPLRKCLSNTITLASRMNDVPAALGMRILEANGFGFAERTFSQHLPRPPAILRRFGGGSYLLTSREPSCALDEPVEGGLLLVAPLPEEGRAPGSRP